MGTDSTSLSLSLPLPPRCSLSHKELLSLYRLLIGTIIQTGHKSLFSATWHFPSQPYNIYLWQYIFKWWISSRGCQHKHREKEAVILFKRREVSHIIPKVGSSLSGCSVPGTPSLVSWVFIKAGRCNCSLAVSMGPTCHRSDSQGNCLPSGNRCRQVQMKHIQTLTARFLIMSIKRMYQCLGCSGHNMPLRLLKMKCCLAFQ